MYSTRIESLVLSTFPFASLSNTLSYIITYNEFYVFPKRWQLDSYTNIKLYLYDIQLYKLIFIINDRSKPRSVKCAKEKKKNILFRIII